MIPLNEECGIIEWVNNTAGLRHILTKLYKERGISYIKAYAFRKGLTICHVHKGGEIIQFGCICMCFQGIYLSGKELRKLILPKTAPFEEKLRIHKEVLCARHPPVFHEWFLRTFPDPTSWYDPALQLHL